MKAAPTREEEKLYPDVKAALESYFRPESLECLIVITAERIPDQIQQRLPDEVLFLLNKRELRPDIMGRVHYDYLSHYTQYAEFFLTVEVKPGSPSLDDFFQAKKYGEIYDAAVTILVGTEKPEERILRLIKRKPVMTHLPMSGFSAYICTFSAEKSIIDWWFQEEPRRH